MDSPFELSRDALPDPESNRVNGKRFRSLPQKALGGLFLTLPGAYPGLDEAGARGLRYFPGPARAWELVQAVQSYIGLL